MHRNTHGRPGWSLAAVILLTACSSTFPNGETATAAPPNTARVGSVERPIVFAFAPSQDVARATASGAALASALSQATGLSWTVTVPASYAAVIESLCAGQTDVATIAPLQMALLVDRGCGHPILSALRRDDAGNLSTTYRSQILVRADSGITDISGLRGKKFAFTYPLSTSGYLFPILLVKQKTGGEIKSFFSSTVFAGDDDSAVLALYRAEVDGSASFIDARTSERMPADIMAKTRRIETAGPVPNDGIAIRRGFATDLRTQLARALVDYCASGAGKVQCKSLFSWDGLQNVGETFYEPLRDAAKIANVDLAAEAAKTPGPPTPSPTKSP